MTLPARTIPGERGLPFLGHTLQFMKNCNQLYQDMHAKHGSVYYNMFLHSKGINLLSPDGYDNHTQEYADQLILEIDSLIPGYKRSIQIDSEKYISDLESDYFY